jgi:putative colanic acid biosynthesis acetyltransferase WcaF
MTILDARTSDSTRGAASFTLSNRLYRIAWAVTWKVLASWTPPAFFRWRRLLLILFGAKLAPTARVYPSASIWSPANLEMAAYACLGPASHAYSMAPIIIGENALVSQGGQLIAGTHDIEDPLFQLQARSITLGARVWIAAEAFVGPGVIVGEGAVLGARGCAFKNLEPWTVYAGNPARAIKPRRVREA